MLENLRKQGASAFVWIIFAILIGMFVVNFGQQSAGARGGCNLGSGKKVTLKVGGSELDETALRLTFNLGNTLQRGGESEVQTRRAFERMIVRELLAGEAERRGLRVADDLVDDDIKHGKLHFNGQVIPASNLFFLIDEDPLSQADLGKQCKADSECKGNLLCKDARCEYAFSYDQFKRILRNWNISIGAYKREQNREVLASTMARILLHEVPASREEAMSEYIAENTKVSFNSVRFDSNKYADALRITDHDLDVFIHAHAAEIQAAYNAEAWKGKKQVHLRRIKVEKSELPPPVNPPAQPADGSPGPAPVPPPPADPAKAKLAALQAQIAAAKRGFKEAAEQTDVNPTIAARGGDWGWYDQGQIALNDPALDAAANALVEGKVSDVIEGADGWYLLIVDEHREGDLTFEQVQRELALPLARTTWGKEAARRAAIAALAEVKAKGKNLADVFAAPDKTGLAPAPLTMISDRPVVWGQAGDTSGSAAPAAGSAAAAPAAPAAGAGSGSAPAAPGAGAGSGSAPAAPSGPPAIMTPSNDALPSLGPVDRPVVERHDGMVRSGDQTPIGDSEELVTALFDELSVGEVAPIIYEVRASVVDPMPQYALVQVTAKDLADVAEFDKQADRLVDRLATIRGIQFVTEWLRNRCNSMAKDGKVKPSWAYLETTDEQNRRVRMNYQPCESLQPRS